MLNTDDDGTLALILEGIGRIEHLSMLWLDGIKRNLIIRAIMHVSDICQQLYQVLQFVLTLGNAYQQ